MTTHSDPETSWGVIFDMDGVLIDSYAAHFEAWRRMLQNHGLDITEAQFAATFGQTNADIFAGLFPSLPRDRYAALGEEKEALFRQVITHRFPEKAGASDLVRALHAAGARLAIGSSGPPENVRAALSRLPAGGLFEATTDGSEIRRGKPHPEVFLKAAAKISLPPRRCVVVEDAPVGVAAGKAAGCAVVAVTGTAPRSQLAEADLVVDSLRELDAARMRSLVPPR